jgi:hypothetical protein
MNNVIRVDFSKALPSPEAIEEDALYYADEVLAEIVPGGELQGDEYVVLNPTRDDAELGSFKFNISSSLWGDFATDDHGKGFISFAHYIYGFDNLPDTLGKL